MEITPVIAGGVLAIAGGAASQWLTHVFSARRERYKLLLEKAESIIDCMDELIRWITEKKATTLSMTADHETVPPIVKLVALQSLYFKNAEPEIEILAKKTQVVIEALTEAHRALKQAERDVKSAANSKDAESAIATMQTVREDHGAAFMKIGNEMLLASGKVTQKLVALIDIETRNYWTRLPRRI